VKITNVRVVRVEGGMRSGQALYETSRGGSPPGRATPYRAQWFYKDVYEPEGGYFEPPAGPGFGYELDEAKIERREEL
jgi:hypothetical protein